MQTAFPRPFELTSRYSPRETLILLSAPLGVTAFLWASRQSDVSAAQFLLAVFLAAVPWWSFRMWLRGPKTGIPLLAFVTFIYWLYFAVPLFWGDRVRPSYGVQSPLPDASITTAMAAATLGVLALAAGKQVKLGRKLALRPLLDLREDGGYTSFLRFLVAGGIAFAFVPSLPYLFGAGLSQILLDIQTVVPLLAYVILLRQVLRGRGTSGDVALLALFLGVGFVAGVGGGWVGSWLTLVTASLVAYLWERGRLPLAAILIGAAYVLFLQPTKQAFRATYWYGNGASASTVDKLASWTSLSASTWSASLTGQGTSPMTFVRQTVMRTSLLTQTANVIDRTPAQVPYQLGATYTYLVAGLIPRYVWPDKPTANDANRFYQVSYGLTTARDVNRVSIAVGALTEGYVNFGWPGILGVMFLLGIVFDFVERTFLAADSGKFFGALGVVILTQFLIIESQLGIYLSGILEKAILAAIIFFPILQVRRRGAESSQTRSGGYPVPGA